MRAVEWIAPAKPPAVRADVRVERRPPYGADRFRDVARGVYHALGQSLQLDRLPYLLARVAGEETAAVALSLHGDDLLILGFGVFDALLRHDVAQALLEEALAVAGETARRRAVAPACNGDLLALLYLQRAGFALEAAMPWTGPGRRGIAGIAATHELVFARSLE